MDFSRRGRGEERKKKNQLAEQVQTDWSRAKMCFDPQAMSELQPRLTCQAAVGTFTDEEQTEETDQVLRKVQLCCHSLYKSAENKKVDLSGKKSRRHITS